jgi:hypothetical protein
LICAISSAMATLNAEREELLVEQIGIVKRVAIALTLASRAR